MLAIAAAAGGCVHGIAGCTREWTKMESACLSSITVQPYRLHYGNQATTIEIKGVT